MLAVLPACNDRQVYYGDMHQVSNWDSEHENLTYTLNVNEREDQSYGVLTANTAYCLKMIVRFNSDFRHETLPLRVKVMKVDTNKDGMTAITRISLANKTEIRTREFHGKAFGNTNMDTSTVEEQLEKFRLEFPEPGQYKIVLSLDPGFSAEGLLAIGLELIKPNSEN